MIKTLFRLAAKSKRRFADLAPSICLPARGTKTAPYVAFVFFLGFSSAVAQAQKPTTTKFDGTYDSVSQIGVCNGRDFGRSGVLIIKNGVASVAGFKGSVDTSGNIVMVLPYWGRIDAKIDESGVVRGAPNIGVGCGTDFIWKKKR